MSQILISEREPIDFPWHSENQNVVATKKKINTCVAMHVMPGAKCFGVIMKYDSDCSSDTT